MTFAVNIAAVPYDPTGPNASGFLAPVLRASGHLLFALAAHSDPDTTLSDEEILGEIQHAKGHWDAIYHGAALSVAADIKVQAFGDALQSALEEFEGWDETIRSSNLRQLADGIVGLGALLDRELVGLTNSQPGYAL
jgi:hypothetical protein